MASEIGRRRVVLDVDVGTDDYLALLMFLFAEERGEVKIEAVVCSSGNTSVQNVCVNVVRLLETVGRTDVSVYKGANKPLVPPDHQIKTFHGSDGFADLQYDHFPDLSVVKKGPAASALGQLIVNNPNEISLVCVAPLTNVALSLRLYEDFADSIKDVWIMGGSHTALGNITATAEYNFYYDPEAAFIVLESVQKPIFLLTWETCLLPKITFDWRYNVFGNANNRAIDLLNKAERIVYGEDEEFWLPCDAFLAAAFLYPDSIITKKSCHNATIELHGSKTRGQIVLDHLKTKDDNITIIEAINCQEFQNLLLKLK